MCEFRRTRDEIGDRILKFIGEVRDAQETS